MGEWQGKEKRIGPMRQIDADEFSLLSWVSVLSVHGRGRKSHSIVDESLTSRFQNRWKHPGCSPGQWPKSGFSAVFCDL